MHCEHPRTRRTWWGARRTRPCGAPAVALVSRTHQGLEHGICISDVTAVCAHCVICEVRCAAIAGLTRIMHLTDDGADPRCPSCGTDLRQTPVFTVHDIPTSEETHA